MTPGSFSESTNQLIKKKSYEGLPKDKGFKYPSESFVKLVGLALDTFENQCMPYFYGQNFLELSYRRIEQQLKNSDLFQNLCVDHRKFMFNKMLKAKINYLCKSYVPMFGKKLVGRKFKKEKMLGLEWRNHLIGKENI